MAEHIDITTLTQDSLNELLRQLHEISEEIAALAAERTSLQNDVARAQQAQSEAPGTLGQPAPLASQHGSVGQPASAAIDGVVRHDRDDDHDTTHPKATNAARSQPRVMISAPTNDLALPSPMPLKPQRPLCFDPSQRGGPTVHVVVHVERIFLRQLRLGGYGEDSLRRVVAARTRYGLVARHRHESDGLRDSTDTGRTNRTLGAVVFRRGAPILHVGRAVRSFIQDYTSGFLALCEPLGYMHESERIDRYIGGLKHDIAQEIQLRGVTDFQEILAMAEKLDFFCQPRPGSYRSNSNWGHRSHGTNEGATIRAVAANAAAAPFKGRCFVCNRQGHRKSEFPESVKGKGEAEQKKQTKQQGNAGSQ
ncbi:unnamed protein product [Closterium sp. NIES-54]